MLNCARTTKSDEIPTTACSTDHGSPNYPKPLLEKEANQHLVCYVADVLNCVLDQELVIRNCGLINDSPAYVVDVCNYLAKQLVRSTFHSLHEGLCWCWHACR